MYGILWPTCASRQLIVQLVGRVASFDSMAVILVAEIGHFQEQSCLL